MRFANNSMLMFRSRNQSPPDNEIWYYAPEKVTLYSESYVTSHTFSGGKGVITFSSAVKALPQTLRETTATDVMLPATVTSVAIHAFSGSKTLARIKFPSGVTSMGNFACYMDPELALTELPASLKTMGGHVFNGCSKLALTSLPEGLTSIGIGVFYDCSKLALTSLPEGLTSIEGNAFLGCRNITLTSLPEGLTSIGGSAFSGCSKLALTSLPEGLTSINDGVFRDCSNIALTSLPAGVTSIGGSAFFNCSSLALTSLPEGVTSIGAYAFFKCTGLTSITFLGTPTTLTANAFFGCTNLKDIYVPWAEGDIGGAPWGATNATVHYTESGGATISFPESFSVTACSGNGAATGAYTKTAETTTVNGTDYPVYSMTQATLATTFYIYVCGYRQGSAGVFWALKAGSYSATDDSYGALGSCAAGTDGLPQSTSWSSASSDATVSW